MSNRQFITAEHFDKTKTFPRFVAWVKYEGLEIGDEWFSKDYIRFIRKARSDFNRITGLGPEQQLKELPNGRRRFTVYLEGLAKIAERVDYDE